jgi:hypothetical protein
MNVVEIREIARHFECSIYVKLGYFEKDAPSKALVNLVLAPSNLAHVHSVYSELLTVGVTFQDTSRISES